MPEPKQLIYYTTEDGRTPFSEWLKDLRDRSAHARILARLNRLRLGLYGDTKRLKNADGVAELRLDVGPGYRIYYADHGTAIVVLLCGGDKSSQRRDIAAAKAYWQDFKERIDD
jgi:putative addiction module killer protein